MNKGSNPRSKVEPGRDEQRLKPRSKVEPGRDEQRLKPRSKVEPGRDEQRETFWTHPENKQTNKKADVVLVTHTTATS